MRVPIVLLTLAITPIFAVAAQGAAAVKDAGQCAVADAHRSPTSSSREQPTDPKGRVRVGCSPVAPAPTDPPPPSEPPPPPPPPPPPQGSVSIVGNVFNDASGYPGLTGWVIELTGAATATTQTDALGNYSFVGLAAGTYTICETVQATWHQTWPWSGPACPTGLGYSFTLSDGQSASLVDFGNAR